MNKVNKIVVSLVCVIGLNLSIVLLGDYYSIGINETDSLPQKIFIIKKGTPSFDKGDYILFRKRSIAEYNRPFIKRVAAVEGDKIKIQDHRFYINDFYLATAKSQNLKGETTNLIEEGTVPQGKYFVYAPHKNSFDSRYKEVGLVDDSDVLGIAYPIL